MIERLHPSYAQGFARSAAESQHPERWRGLRGLWVPELGPTGNTLFDHSSYKNHGALTTMDPSTDWVVGPDGYSLDYDGTSDNVLIGDVPFFDITGEMTVIALINFAAQQGTSIFGKYKATANGRAYLISCLYTGVDGLLLFTVQTNPSSYDTNAEARTANEFDDGERHVVVGRFFPSKYVEIYVDGVFEGTATTPPPSCGVATQPLRMGADGVADANWFTGKIGMCALFARAFSLPEVVAWSNDPYGLLRMRRRRIVKAPAAPPGGLSIPIAMHHYKQLMGAN